MTVPPARPKDTPPPLEKTTVPVEAAVLPPAAMTLPPSPAPPVPPAAPTMDTVLPDTDRVTLLPPAQTRSCPLQFEAPAVFPPKACTSWCALFQSDGRTTAESVPSAMVTVFRCEMATG